MQLYHWNTKQLNLQPNKIESFVLMQMSAFPKRAITHIWLNAYVPEQSRYTFVTLINKHLVCIHGYSFIIIEIGYRNSYNGQEITGICLSVCLFGLSVTLSNNFFSTQKGLNWNFWQMFTSTCVMGSQIGDNLNIFILELLPLFCKKLWQGAGRWRVHSVHLKASLVFTQTISMAVRYFFQIVMALRMNGVQRGFEQIAGSKDHTCLHEY